MFLHAGASLHGHEYSNKTLANHYPHPGPRRSPLLRSAFSSPNPASTPSPRPILPHSYALPVSSTPSTPTATPSPVSIFRSPSAANVPRPPSAIPPRLRPPRPVSDGSFYARKTPVPVVRFQDPVVVRFQDPPVVDVPVRRRPPSPPRAIRPPPPPPPPPPMMIEDESSVSASEASYASDNDPAVVSGTLKHNRRRRAPRKSTTFLFAHPAPKLRTKKQLLQRIRPTLLMQLQQLSDRRPLPVVDVYPASLIAGNVAAPHRFSKLPRLFGVNGELGLHDTILIRNDDYDSQTPGSESDADDDIFDRRPLLAVFSPLRREDRSEIILDDGTIWSAQPLPTGSFDFVRTDAEGHTVTARWVRRAVVKSDVNVDTSCPAEIDYKFVFSVISPDSRRHPIMATLTKATLDVLDYYTTVSPSCGRYPPTRPIHSEHAEASDEEEHHDQASTSSKGRATLPVDDVMKDFICVSAIWVALQIGWAQKQPAALCPMAPSSAAAETHTSRRFSDSFRRRSVPPKLDRSRVESPVGRPLSVANGVIESRGHRVLSRKRSGPTTPVTDCSKQMQQQQQQQDDQGGAPLQPTIRAVARSPAPPAVPAKASSTGAAYMQRRMQLQQLQQMSDNSDSERLSQSGTQQQRRRAFARLSAEYPSKTTQLPTSATPPPPSLQQLQKGVNLSPSSSLRYPQSSGTTATTATSATTATTGTTGTTYSYTTTGLVDHQQSPTPRSQTPTRRFSRQRSHSVSYTANPLAAVGDPSGALDLQEGGASLLLYPPPPPDEKSGGGATKWKKMGHWFKRLGKH